MSEEILLLDLNYESSLPLIIMNPMMMSWGFAAKQYGPFIT